MGKKLEITLRRSPIGRPERQRLNLQGLGLRKLHQTVVREDTKATRGMLARVSHLVEVKEMESP